MHSENKIYRNILILLKVLHAMKYVVNLYLNHFMAKQSNFIVEKAEKIDSNQLDTFLREGHLTVCHARCIIVGCAGAGKTTLLKRLQGMSYRDVREKTETKLVDVYVNSFEVLEKENTIQSKIHPA